MSRTFSIMLVKNLSIIDTHLKVFDEIWKKRIEDLCARDEKGNPVIVNNQYQFHDRQDPQGFVKEFLAILETEVM